MLDEESKENVVMIDEIPLYESSNIICERGNRLLQPMDNMMDINIDVKLSEKKLFDSSCFDSFKKILELDQNGYNAQKFINKKKEHYTEKYNIINFKIDKDIEYSMALFTPNRKKYRRIYYVFIELIDKSKSYEYKSFKRWKFENITDWDIFIEYYLLHITHLKNAQRIANDNYVNLVISMLINHHHEFLLQFMTSTDSMEIHKYLLRNYIETKKNKDIDSAKELLDYVNRSGEYFKNMTVLDMLLSSR